MQTSFKFNTADFDNFLRDSIKEVKKNIEKGVTEATELVTKEVKKISPKDTGAYEKSHKSKVQVKKQQTIGTIESNLPYSDILEEGVKWKSYNYHRWKKVIYSGVWNKTYKRAREKLEQVIEKTVTKYL